ncbi:MAG: hypothetical protein EGR90_04685 [Lachnospiraceae bacterium]|nr:hypothetical protein [Lachnospiraceae bacterium]
MGLDSKTVNASEIHSDYVAMQTRKNELLRTLSSTENEVKKMRQNLANVEQYVEKDLFLQICKDLHKSGDTL